MALERHSIFVSVFRRFGINFDIILRAKTLPTRNDESHTEFVAFGRSFGGEGRRPTELARARPSSPATAGCLAVW